LGSGRSGTTLFATILNSTKQIQTLGELHQFYVHIEEGLKCSCGSGLKDCEFWKLVLSKMELTQKDLSVLSQSQNHEEQHKFILSILLGKKASLDYLKSQQLLFNALNRENSTWFLDSSKYIGRFLLLKKLDFLNVKGIYVVRDVRGVIHSFSKKVQTTRGPLNTVVYYLLTNIFGQICAWLFKDVIKIRYEDLIDTPEKTIHKVYKLIDQKYDETIASDFIMPHIIGGNRLKSNKSIAIKKDFAWKEKISRSKQILYYVLAFPIMILNKYTI
jgi:hypothetical protein